MQNSRKNVVKSFLLLFVILCCYTPNFACGGYYFLANENIALHKSTKQSSNYHSSLGLSKNAVDGNTSGAWGNRSVTHTREVENNPWWEVDLGAVYDISKIEIWNRTDCCRERLDNMKILIKNTANEAGTPFLRQNHRYCLGESYPLTFQNNKKGRFVRIQLINPRGILSLAEVKVYGTKADPRSLPNAIFIKNMETQRFAFASGDEFTGQEGDEGGWLQSPSIVGADKNYYNRAVWELVRVPNTNLFKIKNSMTNRYLFCTGEKIAQANGQEGGWLESKAIVGADANYYNRAFWKFKKFGNTGAYFIINSETNRMLFSTGDKVNGDEGGWLQSPKVVGTDANYYNRAGWVITGNGLTLIQ